MPIATETLRIGFTVAALPGTYVSKQAVKDNGWEDLVEDGDDQGGTVPDNQKDAKAPKGAPQKGA